MSFHGFTGRPYLGFGRGGRHSDERRHGGAVRCRGHHVDRGWWAEQALEVRCKEGDNVGPSLRQIMLKALEVRCKEGDHRRA